jgi:Uncharacterized conserved protein
MDKKAHLVAVASSDGIVVNSHFGRAKTFYIYEINERGEHFLREIRKMEPVCEGGTHQEQRLKESIGKLVDCKYVLVARIGSEAANALERFGIIPMELPGMLQVSLEKLITYEKLQNLF